MQISRRQFIVGTAVAAAGAGLYSLRPKHYEPAAPRPLDK
ncbi:MAG: twin-arginine translocation signal domain-containing protein, partial [Sterolibacterium sp.]|nr:twin-arginine translocation signal domain-containing protein [Sterolibacterium sp.]MBP9799034.1 twin-arginine translocation signal domain-containing protein [Sterolibacterium sp.]